MSFPGIRNDPLIAPHELCLELGGTAQFRRETYRGLFVDTIAQTDLNAIREATNKAWVLGNNGFKMRIQRQLQSQAGPKPRGGDRKSENFRKGQETNRV